MRVRGIDGNNDWLFGKGANDYKFNRDAVSQNIKTRLQSFLGDCFFDLGAGIDWFNLLGGKSKLAIDLAIRTVILNTEEVTSLKQLNIIEGENRNLLLSYEVTTIYGEITAQEIVQVTPTPDGNFLLLENGGYLLLENGGQILL